MLLIWLKEDYEWKYTYLIRQRLLQILLLFLLLFIISSTDYRYNIHSVSLEYEESSNR